jgi:hypothetical protein
MPLSVNIVKDRRWAVSGLGPGHHEFTKPSGDGLARLWLAIAILEAARDGVGEWGRGP